MRYRNLGNIDIKVSELCLGTMTWGSQNSEQEGHQQIDMALDHGINFIDTAEMYPTTPLSSETCGRTEEITGSWIKKSQRRQDIILATKVVGIGFQAIREGGPITKNVIDQAIEGSLKRLQTDYIDLYQLHWPNRGSYHFRNNWHFKAHEQDRSAAQDMLESLEALEPHIQAGRIRHIGLSNESAWGTMKFLELAKTHNLTSVVSIQNEYNLMCRLYDLDMAELSHQENIGLLAYSPLAAGLLSGKYYNNATPKNSRRDISSDNLHGRLSERSMPIADAYTDIAKKHQLEPAQMALAYCREKSFVNSTIIGATNLEQLKMNINSVEIDLSKEVSDDIAALYTKYPIPM